MAVSAQNAYDRLLGVSRKIQNDADLLCSIRARLAARHGVHGRGAKAWVRVAVRLPQAGLNFGKVVPWDQDDVLNGSELMRPLSLNGRENTGAA